jgi:hypothetical protein
VSHRVSGRAACPRRLYYTRYYIGAAVSTSQATAGTLARQRPGVRSIRIKYGGGRFDNVEPRRFRPRVNARRSQIRLRQQRRHLVFDLPGASEATVPQRLIPLRQIPG